MPQYKAPTCRRVGPLSDKARDRLPDKAFGIPSQRKYPMPDPRHAGNAKGRAKTAFDRGEVTRKQYDAIVRKADRIIAQCNGTSGLKGRRGSPSQSPAYRRELAACKLRNRCSSRRGKRESDCVRACKGAATRRRR